MRMTITVLVLVAVAAVAEAKRGGRGPRPGGMHDDIFADIPEENREQAMECKRALKPEGGKQTKKENMDACLEELGIEKPNMEGVSRRERKAAMKEFLDNLEATQKVDLQKCLATREGFVTADNIDMDAVRTTITDRVTGASQTIIDNVAVAVADCPEITDFDVKAYMKCVLVTCATGSVPAATP